MVLHEKEEKIESNELAQGERFNIEVSADKPYGTMKPKTEDLHQNVDLSTLTGVIAESDTRHFAFSPMPTDLHNRTIMISTNPKDLTDKCSRVFDGIRQQEYAAMIE
jgi:hypothetical protein